MSAEIASQAGWRSRVVTAEAAASTVKPGDRVFLGSACATPRRLVRALERLPDTPAGVRLFHFLTDGAVDELAGEPYTRFPHRVFYVGRDMRGIAPLGKLDYVPISVTRVPALLESGRLGVDVAFVQLSPPDEDGSCSLGVSVDVTASAVRHARRVIAEINPRMPRTRGETTVPASRIDLFVDVDEPVIEYVHEPADGIAQEIARFVARLIDDGATLQIGLGRIPNEMLRYLTSRRDLGVHSDVITEPLLDLIEAGIVTGGRKTSFPGKVVASYCMGTRRLYDFVDGNDLFHFLPIEKSSRPAAIAANDQMVSVTQAFAIDLTGQVCADQFRGELYGGVSTQGDFMRGAAASRGGKAIVCLASTTDDGATSRIRPHLSAVEAVTIPRSDVHYVVTEYGTAYLFGATVRERAVALIEIAHPRFRDELLAEAQKSGLLGKDVRIKSRVAYPAEEETTVALKDGTRLRLRPTRAADVGPIQDLFYSLSERDIFTRFFTNLKSLSVSKAQHLCSVDYRNEMAFLAVEGDQERERVLGSSCYYVNQTTNLADVAFMIRPEGQGRGLASQLMRRMIAYARTRGVRGFTADVLCDNAAMLAVFERSGCQVQKKVVSGTYEVTLLFPNEP